MTTVLIPKLTGGPGQKFVKKDMTNSEVNDTKNQNNGPSSATTSTPASSTGDVNNATSSKSLVANYSDNSSPEDDQISRGAPSPTDSNKGSSSPVGAGGALEMEVDEDGAPVQSTTPILKRPSPDSTSNSELSTTNDSAAKKAKIDVEDNNADPADDTVDHNAALVTSSNDA